MASGGSLIRAFLLLLNFVFFVAGLTCVCLGFFVLLDKPRLNPLLNLDNGSGTTVQILTSSAIIMNVIGWVTIIFAILGCCGAGKKSKILLSVYIGLTSLLFIVDLVGGALAAYYRTQTDTAMQTWMFKKLNTSFDGRGDSQIEFSSSLDFAHQEFDCCGILDYTDFKKKANAWTERASRKIPISCCKLNKTAFYNQNVFRPFNVTCTTNPTIETANIHQPCFEKIRDHLMTQGLYLIIMAFILITLELLGVVLSCILMRTIKDTTV